MNYDLIDITSIYTINSELHYNGHRFEVMRGIAAWSGDENIYQGHCLDCNNEFNNCGELNCLTHEEKAIKNIIE